MTCKWEDKGIGDLLKNYFTPPEELPPLIPEGFNFIKPEPDYRGLTRKERRAKQRARREKFGVSIWGSHIKIANN